MSYPGLSHDVAQLIDESRRRNGLPSVNLDEATAWRSGPDFKIETARHCLNLVWELVNEADDSGKSPATFDSVCAPVIHETLKLPTRIAGDADFWRWLTFIDDCNGADIVDWRYGQRRRDTIQPARPVYYGLGLMKKGMFAKLWTCANIMHVETHRKPYDGIEYADVDFWDSHIIDVDYGSVPSMARAFVKVVRDQKLPRGNPKTSDASIGYRELAKEIRRRNATVAFEVFDEAEAYEYILGIWSERESWCGR